MHGCPHYGPAVYDEEGYNQEGYHRTTGLNREGRTRREQARLNPDGEDEDEDDEDDEDDDPDDEHFVLQHVDAAMQAVFAGLPHQDREPFLLNLQIQLFEERGITFPPRDEHGRGDDGSEDGLENESDIDGDNENLDIESDLDERGGDSDEEFDEEELNNAGPGDGAAGDGQDNGLFFVTVGTLRGKSVLLDGVVDEADSNAHEQDIEELRNGALSSVGTPEDDLPGSPMDVDSLEESSKQERESWRGTSPTRWPGDEDL